MKQGQYWSEDYNCPVSLTFYNGAKRHASNIKIDITNCYIIITEFGHFQLWYKGKRIKDLDFSEYMKYKKFVKEIINNDRGQDYG